MRKFKTINPLDLNTSQIHKILLNAITPRPIALASTVDNNENVNLSPFSYFNVFSASPPILVFSPANRVTDNSKKEGERNQKELNKPNNELGKENSVNLNLAITYSEMNQIDKAKEFLNKIKLDQLEEEEKNTYQTISQKLK